MSMSWGRSPTSPLLRAFSHVSTNLGIRLRPTCVFHSFVKADVEQTLDSLYSLSCVLRYVEAAPDSSSRSTTFANGCVLVDSLLGPVKKRTTRS